MPGREAVRASAIARSSTRHRSSPTSSNRPGATRASASQTFHDAPLSVDIADAREHVEVAAGSRARRARPKRARSPRAPRQRSGGVGEHIGAGLELAVVDDRLARQQHGSAERRRRIGGVVAVARRRPASAGRSRSERRRRASHSVLGLAPGGGQPGSSRHPLPTRSPVTNTLTRRVGARAGRRRAGAPAATRSPRASRRPAARATVCVQGPMISCGSWPAACSASKSSSIHGRKMSYQPPISCTGAVTFVDAGRVVARHPVGVVAMPDGEPLAEPVDLGAGGALVESRRSAARRAARAAGAGRGPIATGASRRSCSATAPATTPTSRARGCRRRTSGRGTARRWPGSQRREVVARVGRDRPLHQAEVAGPIIPIRLGVPRLLAEPAQRGQPVRALVERAELAPGAERAADALDTTCSPRSASSRPNSRPTNCCVRTASGPGPWAGAGRALACATQRSASSTAPSSIVTRRSASMDHVVGQRRARPIRRAMISLARVMRRS